MQRMLFKASRRAMLALFIAVFLFLNSAGVERAASPAQPVCPPPTINGRLGSGSTDYPGVSGTLLGRLNRNGVAGGCNSPKTCSLATGVGQRAYDAYTFRNSGAAQACVTVTLNVPQQLGANYQANSYLGSFNPNDLCANYLADPGVSSATLSVPIVYSHTVPAGATFVVIEHNMDFVMDLCHRIMVMVEGTVMAIGTPAEVRANKQVLDAYLGN